MSRCRSCRGHARGGEACTFRTRQSSGSVATGALTAAAVAGTVATLRSRALRWGATRGEVDSALPGDELILHPGLSATRAITIRADAAAVWPWVAQLGQGRGGFYSYDALENLVGCNIHSADVIVPEWQPIAVGDEIRLHPDGGLQVALVDPGRALVLRGGVPMGTTPPPYDFTWTFVVHDAPGGNARLLVRERYGYVKDWAPLLVEPASLISFLMSRRMLLGIKARAERPADLPGEDTDSLN
jgi:hypothetical protein